MNDKRDDEIWVGLRVFDMTNPQFEILKNIFSDVPLCVDPEPYSKNSGIIGTITYMENIDFIKRFESFLLMTEISPETVDVFFSFLTSYDCGIFSLPKDLMYLIAKGYAKKDVVVSYVYTEP